MMAIKKTTEQSGTLPEARKFEVEKKPEAFGPKESETPTPKQLYPNLFMGSRTSLEQGGVIIQKPIKPKMIYRFK